MIGHTRERSSPEDFDATQRAYCPCNTSGGIGPVLLQVAFGEAGEEPEYFEFFSEKAIMTLFVKALRLGPAIIKTQVEIKTRCSKLDDRGGSKHGCCFWGLSRLE